MPRHSFKHLGAALYVLGILTICWSCYRHPLSEDFDRYMYESLVRARQQDVQTVYGIVKHESPRAESSSILDSPEHLEKLKPLYAIRPLYVEVIRFLWKAGLGIQQSINLISAASLFGIGILLLFWTDRPLESALLLACSPIVVLGRMGTPDALSGFLVISALWAITYGRQAFGISAMLASLFVRTDNLLLFLVVVLWLLLERRIQVWLGCLLCITAVSIAFGINKWAGAYSWAVLFQYSFIGGRSPADVSSHVSAGEYLRVFISSGVSLVSRLSIWLLLAFVAWKNARSDRRLLIVGALSAVAHFVLFPSPEDRYLIWTYVLVGIIFVRSIRPPRAVNIEA